MSVKIDWAAELQAAITPPDERLSEAVIVDVWCPHCGSDRIESQDRVVVMYEVGLWEWDAERRGGSAVPHDYGSSETVYDSAELLTDDDGNEVPYYCVGCYTDLRDDELVVTDPANDHRRVG